VTTGISEVYCDRRLGSKSRYYLGRPIDFDMRVPDEIRDCVVFLCVQVGQEGAQRFRYGGTAFFVSTPSETRPDAAYVYLVTARHNIEKSKQHGALYLRVNTKNQKAEFLQIEDKWLYPDNAAVDIAILAIAALPDRFQYRYLGSEMFATDEVLKGHNIGIGDDLLIAGLFTQRHGTQRNLPIVRTGIIAATPDEPLQDKDSGLDYDAYLAEVRSIGGLSGSPVFVFLEPGRVHSRTISNFRKSYLLGVIRGHWDYKHRETLVNFGDDELQYVNMGIAIITPIREVLAVLNGEALTKLRRDLDKTIAIKTAPIPDTEFL